MAYKQHHLLVAAITCIPFLSLAQEPIQEGSILYKVSIYDASSKTSNTKVSGTYLITFKGAQLKKELKLNNGYSDVLVFSNNMNTFYSLKTQGSKKYAIQLSIDDFINRNKNFEQYTLVNMPGETKTIAGLNAQKATITYNDGMSTNIYYCTDARWHPANKWLLEHFPDIKYLPLSFEYTGDNGMNTLFTAEKIDSEPIEDNAFKIPTDYKIISYAEFKQMSK
jgi:hypothetical protein